MFKPNIFFYKNIDCGPTCPDRTRPKFLWSTDPTDSGPVRSDLGPVNTPTHYAKNVLSE